MRLRQALDQFLVQLEADGRSVHTRHQYRRHVLLLDGWLARTRRSRALSKIDHTVLAAFLVSDDARLRPDGQPKTTTSMNALRTSVRTFFGHCEAAGYVRTNPARLVRRARCSPPPPRALSDAEVHRLLAAVDAGEGETATRDGVLIRVLLRAGLRLGSALGLRVEDVDLAGRQLYLRKAKNDRPITLPISVELARDLRRDLRRRPPGWLFAGPGGEPLTSRQASRRIRTWARAAGLDGRATAHALRHTYATRLYERTGDLLVVQQALGHASIASTTVYAALTPRRLRRALSP